jgi:hypothetical protein
MGSPPPSLGLPGCGGSQREPAPSPDSKVWSDPEYQLASGESEALDLAKSHLGLFLAWLEMLRVAHRDYYDRTPNDLGRIRKMDSSLP